MKTFLEAALGLTAWACAIFTVLILILVGELNVYLLWAVLYLPVTWIVLLITARLVLRKNLWQLWWIWISAPLVFAYWILLFVFVYDWVPIR